MTRATEPPLLTDLMRFRPEGWTANAWAVEAGVSRTVWTDIRRHGNPSRRTLEKLLVAAGSSLAEFEALRVGDAPPPAAGGVTGVGDAPAPSWRPAPLSPVPLLATTLAGEWGEAGQRIEVAALDSRHIAEHLSRPESLAGDRDAYAVTIVGDSMWPRFRPGRRILVSPRAPVAIGDDVVVRLRGPGDTADPMVRSVIKELVRRAAGFVELRQFTPDIVFRVEASDIVAIHKVVGEAF